MYSLFNLSYFSFECISFQILISKDSPHAIFTEAGCPDMFLSQGEPKGRNAFPSIGFNLNDGQVFKLNPTAVFCILKVPVDGASLLEVPVH